MIRSRHGSRGSRDSSSSEATMPPNEQLEKLASTGILKREPPSKREIDGLIRSAAARLEDAQKTTNSPRSVEI
jgi:hypothetical protein